MQAYVTMSCNGHLVRYLTQYHPFLCVSGHLIPYSVRCGEN
jgi:hypothetical protein